MKSLKQNYEIGDVAYGRSSARSIYLKEYWLDPVYKNLDVFEENERDKFERTNTTNKSFKPLIGNDVLKKLLKNEEPSEASKEKNFVMRELKLVTVDDFNNYGDLKDVFDRDTENADFLNSDAYKELDQQDHTPPGLRNYWHSLIASKYSPEKLPKISDKDANLEWSTLAKNYPDIGLLSTKLDKSGLSDNRQKLKYLALRHACKFGIAHMTGTGKRVHFVLDGINMWDVAEKRPVDINNDKPGVSITTSELRYESP